MAPTVPLGPRVKRGGIHIYVLESEFDWDAKGAQFGERFPIPSICGTKGAKWDMRWFTEAEALENLCLGFSYAGMRQGGLNDVESIECTAKVDGIVKQFGPISALSQSAAVFGVRRWEHPKGELTGKTSIEYTLKVMYQGYKELEPVVKVSDYYTDVNSAQNPITNDVKFVFHPSELVLWSTVDTLSRASPYFKTMFESGFAESTEEPPAKRSKSTRAVVERDFDDSDDETDDLMVAERVAVPVNGGASELPARTIHIDAACYTTYRALLFWLQTGHVTFAPLRSSQRHKENPIDSRNEAITAALDESSYPRHASPKSIYRLAHYLEIPALAELALESIKSQLTVENIAWEVFGDVALAHDPVGDAAIEFAGTRMVKMQATRAFDEVSTLVESGEMPSYTVMSIKLIKRQK